MVERDRSVAKVFWTSKGIEALKVKRRMDFTDPSTPGLVLRVTPRGTKTWAFLYARKGDGQKRRVTIGNYGLGNGKVGLLGRVNAPRPSGLR